MCRRAVAKLPLLLREKKTYPLGVCDWTLGGVGNPGALGTAKLAGLDGVQISSAAPKPEGEFSRKRRSPNTKRRWSKPA